MSAKLWQRLLARLRVRPENDRARRGRLGERAAERHLKRERGMRPVARNWRHGRDEVDLVMRAGDTLVFVEVRSRAVEAQVGGYHSVTAHKKQCLRRASIAYLRALRVQPSAYRFDIVEVRLGNDAVLSIHHYANVPLFSEQ